MPVQFLRYDLNLSTIHRTIHPLLLSDLSQSLSVLSLPLLFFFHVLYSFTWCLRVSVLSFPGCRFPPSIATAGTMSVLKFTLTFQKRVRLAQGLWLLSWIAVLSGVMVFSMGVFLKTELMRRAEVGLHTGLLCWNPSNGFVCNHLCYLVIQVRLGFWSRLYIRLYRSDHPNRLICQDLLFIRVDIPGHPADQRCVISLCCWNHPNIFICNILLLSHLSRHLRFSSSELRSAFIDLCPEKVQNRCICKGSLFSSSY